MQEREKEHFREKSAFLVRPRKNAKQHSDNRTRNQGEPNKNAELK